MTITEEKETWHLKRRGAVATATFTDEGLVVHKGSICSKDFTPSAEGTPFERRRQKLVEDGILEESEKGLIFTEDYRFKSPSGAAATISGGHANGWIEWKDASGKSMKEVKRSE